MPRFKKVVFLTLCATFCLASLVSAADVKAEAEAIVAKMPAQNPKAQYAAAEELVKLGPAAIAHVCGMLTPPSTGGDTHVRFALNALTWYAHRSGNAPVGKMVAGAFLDALKAASDNEVKAFLIRQLHLLESEQAVAPLGELLSDARLCEPATQALLAIATPEAAKVLAKALPSAQDKNLVTIVKALGELREKSSVSIIAGHAASENTALRRTALFALANIGDPSSEKILAQAAKTGSRYEKANVTSLTLLYARRLAEQGRKNDCTRICRDLIKAHAESGEAHVQSAALSVLVKTLGAEATGDIMAALNSENKAVYAAALKLAMNVPGETMTSNLAGQMKRAAPGVKLEIIEMLGARADTSALPGLLAGLKDQDKAVRLAAASAASRVGGAKVAPALVAALTTAENDEIAAIKQIILRLPGDEAMAAVAEALPNAEPGIKIELIDILSTRRAVAHKKVVVSELKNASKPVRVAAVRALGNLGDGEEMPLLVSLLVTAESGKEQAAIQAVVASIARKSKDDSRVLKAVQAGIKGADPEARSALLGILPAIGSRAALTSLLAESNSDDIAVKDAAIRALSNWPDVSAGAAMLEVARNSEELKHQVLAIRGYVRVVGGADLPATKKVAMYSDAIAAAKRPEEKRLVLGGLSEITHKDALAAVARHLDDKEINQEAAAVAVKIACPRKGSAGLQGDGVKEVLMQVIAVSTNAKVKDAAQNHLQTAEVSSTPLAGPDAEGFTALFNGKDLSGWKGLVADPEKRAKMAPAALKAAQKKADESMRAHWNIADGMLVFDGKGKSLCTAKDYGDFEMLVDWKIKKNGDSGIYLRGSPQVQIWDTAKWPEGSGGLYNNKKNPRKPLTCADNPVGEWNTFRIKMVGEKVTVHLNDTLVTDAVIMENYWNRNKPIYPTGQIELQNHGNTLWFRNVFIREL